MLDNKTTKYLFQSNSVRIGERITILSSKRILRHLKAFIFIFALFYRFVAIVEAYFYVGAVTEWFVLGVTTST